MTVGCFAQTAKVIALTPDETDDIRLMQNTLTNLLQAVEEQKAEIAAYDLKIEQKYISLRFPTTASICIETKEDLAKGIHCLPPPLPLVDDPDKSWQRMDGWENGFEYSEDYKFIVPKARAYNTTSTCICGYGTTTCPCLYTPAGNPYDTWR
jgi:hypothetical protein